MAPAVKKKRSQHMWRINSGFLNLSDDSEARQFGKHFRIHASISAPANYYNGARSVSIPNCSQMTCGKAAAMTKLRRPGFGRRSFAIFSDGGEGSHLAE